MLYNYLEFCLLFNYIWGKYFQESVLHTKERNLEALLLHNNMAERTLRTGLACYYC